MDGSPYHSSPSPRVSYELLNEPEDRKTRMVASAERWEGGGMSRIDQIQAKLTETVSDKRTLQRAVNVTVEKEAELRKELAALKAETKPREFVIGIDKSGNVVSLANYGSDLHFYFQGNVPRVDKFIPAIEKKAIVVTVDMAAKFYRAFNSEMGFVHQHKRMVTGLNAIGIEAMASDE